jgi:hypothetical protein
MFRHRRFPKPTLDILTCKHPLNGITYCEIYRCTGEGMTSIMICGRAYAKHPDTYNKSVGRKRSLTSALAKINVLSKDRIFNREERELIWSAYWEMVNPIKVPLHPYGPVQAVVIPDAVVAEGLE